MVTRRNEMTTIARVGIGLISILLAGCGTGGFEFGLAQPAPKPRQSAGVDKVIFKNESGKTLHIYFVFKTIGLSNDCVELKYDGSIGPGDVRPYDVPGGSIGWFRFQEDQRDAGCASYNNKFETWITGSSKGIITPINIL
jgi:hypothetical protein